MALALYHYVIFLLAYHEIRLSKKYKKSLLCLTFDSVLEKIYINCLTITHKLYTFKKMI